MPMPPANSSERVQIQNVKIFEQRDKQEREELLDQMSALEAKMNKKKGTR